MSYFSRLIIFSSIESFATALVQRGVFFYTRETLAFGETQNLVLALGMGTAYVVGAFLSHRVSEWFGERWVLLGLLIIQTGVLVAVSQRPQGWLLSVGSLGFSCLNGMMWPIVENYVSAVQTPLESFFHSPLVFKGTLYLPS